MRGNWRTGPEMTDVLEILRGAVPAMDRIFGRIWEEGDAYWVEAQVPGINREQLSLQAHQQQLTLSTINAQPEGAEAQPNGEASDPWTRGRRAPQSLKVVWTLPLDVDVGAIEARLTDGLFRARLPRRQSVNEKIDIVVK